MSDDRQPVEMKPSSVNLSLIALVSCGFATMPQAIIVSLLLIDIGMTFGYPVGIMGEIGTVSSIVSVIASLFIGALSIRFRYRSLLLVGLLSISTSTLSYGLASGLGMMLLSYIFSGIGGAMVIPMAMALIAEHFPPERRTGAIGWLNASLGLSAIIGGPAIGLIAVAGGWRSTFLAYTLPFSLLSLLLIAMGLPSSSSSSHESQPASGQMNYAEGFRAIFTNRSASCCLIAWAFLYAAWQAILTYGSSFFRERFAMSVGFVSILILGVSSLYALGGLLTDRLARRFGRRPLLVSVALLAGMSTIAYTNLPDLWLSVASDFLSALFYGIASTATSSLTLEQVPRFRGTMMSLNQVAGSVGAAFGAGLGGIVLLSSGYGSVGISLGSMFIVSAIIFHLLVQDST